MMPKYAKSQSLDFKNTIQSVAIVGVIKPPSNTLYTTRLTNTHRPEVPLDRILQMPYYRSEDTQSRLFLAKAAVTDSPRAS